MAGAARIGSLHVLLGLDSAEFTAGMAKANSGLAKFSKAAKIGFAAVAVAATAATAAGAALAVAVKGAIDNADELSKTAQKVGVTTEALSRLKYAADLSDVSLQQLSTGLGKLTVGMSQIAQGAGGQAKVAFDALGISALTSTGQLRASDEVFADVAERFARMEDGATKTALAIALFGKSGAQLIPMLNTGKAGLADLAAEADRLGITLDTNTGKAAEQFNDSITRMQATFQGVINKVMEGALPALNQFADKIADPAFAENAQAIGEAIVGAMSLAVDAINAAVGAFNSLRESMAWASTHTMFGDKLEPSRWDQLKGQIDAKRSVGRQLTAGSTGVDTDSLYRGIYGATPSEIASASKEVAEAFEPVIANTAAASAAASALKATMAEGKAVFETTRTPAEAYGLEIERLNALLQKGAIDQDTYNRAVLQAQDSFREAEMSGNQLASTLSSGLANMFSSVVDGSKSAVEAIGDLLKSLGQMLIHKGFEMLIGGFFGSGGGLGNLFGGLFGGGGGLQLGFQKGIPGFANGTNFAPGGLALVGERGPELVNLPRGSQVTPNEMLGGGPNITIEITGSKQDAAEIAREVRKVLPDAIQSYNRNPLRRS